MFLNHVCIVFENKSLALKKLKRHNPKKETKKRAKKWQNDEEKKNMGM